MQQTTIAEEREDPDLSVPVHQSRDDSVMADAPPEANPVSASPIPPPVEKDDDVQVTGSQFVQQPDTSSVLAKIVSDIKPAEKSKVSVPNTGSLENLDFSSLLQEYTQNRRREDNIIEILKKKYEVSLLLCP